MEKPLIIFDSGIGGLSILKELLKLNFNYPLLYFADQAYFPYGSKSPLVLRHRLLKLFSYLADFKPSGVVVACNTATSISLDQLRFRFDFPLIGVEPVIKPLSEFSPALLLATPVTISSKRTRELIERYRPSQLYLYPSKNLAFYIETMNFSSIKQELTQIKLRYPFDFQAIGLSCTHYPLIKNLLATTFGKIRLIDPSPAVAGQIIKVFGNKSNQKLNRSLPETVHWQTTGDPNFLEDQVAHYLGFKIKASLASLS